MTKTKATKDKKEKLILEAPTRGRSFEGVVVKKFPMRVVIERVRTLYVHKYERFYTKKMRLHARVPKNLEVNVGDLVRVQECRPLSKIIHAIVTEKVKGSGEIKK